MTQLRITAEERNALYHGILDHLHGIGDLPMVIEAGDAANATRLAREYADDLLFVLGDLKFDTELHEVIELTTPADVLRRILRRLQTQAEMAERREVAERAAVIRAQNENQSLGETCRRLRSELAECT